MRSSSQHRFVASTCRPAPHNAAFTLFVPLHLGDAVGCVSGPLPWMTAQLDGEGWPSTMESRRPSVPMRRALAMELAVGGHMPAGGADGLATPGEAHVNDTNRRAPQAGPAADVEKTGATRCHPSEQTNVHDRTRRERLHDCG